MKNFVLNIQILIFEIISFLLNFRYNGFPLRIKLFKKRILGFIIITIVFFLMLYHAHYVFLDFAFSEKAGKYSIYEQILQCHATWYRASVSRGFRWIWIMYVCYLIYFIVSSFSVRVFAYAARHRDSILLVFTIGFLVYNNWFTYGYLFYICQANVMVLACFIYNALYWVFHLIMWDEEMEMYYENQVDLAMQGREGFVHKENRKSTDEDEYFTPKKTVIEDNTRPDLLGGMRITSPGDRAEKLLKQLSSDSRYINFETLRVTKEFEEGNTVENLEDIESRYHKHIKTFYGVEVEEAERIRKEESGKTYELLDEMVDFWMVYHYVIFPVRWWEDVLQWKQLYRRDIIRIYIMAVYHFIKHNQYKKPKVVGPYSIFSPFYKADCVAQANWADWKFLIFFKNAYNKFLSLFNLYSKYQNWRWFLFTLRFLPQRLKLIKKRKTINYRFFKQVQVNNV